VAWGVDYCAAEACLTMLKGHGERRGHLICRAGSMLPVEHVCPALRCSAVVLPEAATLRYDRLTHAASAVPAAEPCPAAKPAPQAPFATASATQPPLS